MAKEARKTKDHPAVKAMLDQREEQNKSNLEAIKRVDSMRPTPTQEENDLAKLGVLLDEKEPDGSGPTIITKTLVANEPLGSEAYRTRSVQAEKNQPKSRE